MNFAGVQSVTIPEGDVKIIAIGGVTVWMKPNPLPYDAEVDYVESAGAQYVDTGLQLTSADRVECRFALTDISGTTEQINGQTGTDIRFAFGKAGSNVNFYAGLGNLNYWTTLPLDTNAHDLALDAPNKAVTIDSATWPVSWAAFATPTGTAGWSLFARTAIMSGAMSTYAKERIYSAKIYTSGVLVRDFVPVRVGTAGYLYDRANPTGGPLGNGLYGSATATPLVAGPDKNGV